MTGYYMLNGRKVLEKCSEKYIGVYKKIKSKCCYSTGKSISIFNNQ